MIPCAVCKQDSGWTEELFHSWVANSNPEVPKCDPCIDRILTEEKEQDAPVKFTHKLGMIEDIIPPLYLETEYKKLPIEAQKLWQHIKHWSPSISKGLYLLGESRTGKTRTLTLLLQRLHKEGYPIKLFLAGQFHAQLADAKRSTYFKQWRDELVDIDLLAIDDLFAEKLTPTTQAGLFEIIEQRMAFKKPILVTTQVARKEAVKQFDDPRRGEALLNRLRETTDLYIMDVDQLQEKLAI
jgi:DNA replication protein DnaC